MILLKKNFRKPDESQTLQNSRVDTIRMGDMIMTKQTFDPGWKWSKDMKSIAKTDSCQIHHVGIFISGRMRVRTDDTQEMEFGPGDVADIPPGHDGWVVGNEPAVFYAFVRPTA